MSENVGDEALKRAKRLWRLGESEQYRCQEAREGSRNAGKDVGGSCRGELIVPMVAKSGAAVWALWHLKTSNHALRTATLGITRRLGICTNDELGF
jgi:hypothetical protein